MFFIWPTFSSLIRYLYLKSRSHREAEDCDAHVLVRVGVMHHVMRVANTLRGPRWWPWWWWWWCGGGGNSPWWQDSHSDHSPRVYRGWAHLGSHTATSTSPPPFSRYFSLPVSRACNHQRLADLTRHIYRPYTFLINMRRRACDGTTGHHCIGRRVINISAASPEMSPHRITTEKMTPIQSSTLMSHQLCPTFLQRTSSSVNLHCFHPWRVAGKNPPSIHPPSKWVSLIPTPWPSVIRLY